ncbi:site-specific integrase [Prevotella sp. A2931]|uniref:Site-specific integrase n=1 Tax=Prevotella illustrans TaxID=2800387 RepID=A0ABS3M7E8_9BACT|nr:MULTISPECIES: site-specific integrase [Prevotella]MBO1364108.1 site-specific integrase [Prevotella illustrans]
MTFKSIISFFSKPGGQKFYDAAPTRKQLVAHQASPLLTEFLPIAAKGTSISTTGNYKTAVLSFTRFNNNKDIALASIHSGLVKGYERWLQDCGVCANTSSCYLRALRAIYNKAVAMRKVRDRKPFSHVFTGNEKTAKRSIGMEDIRKITAIDLSETPWLEPVKDMFLFSFYAMGMPFVDLAFLKRSQIKDGILTYYRRKTRKQVRVKLEKCMLHLISRYATRQTDYVFPILYKVRNGEVCRADYSSALNRYNRLLKELSSLAGVSVGLTSYVARHSWASIAYDKNIDLPVISQALGHTDTRTTLIYIREIDDRRLMQANRKILKELLPLGKRWAYL